MSSSPVQDLLDRIDRLHLMLSNELPSLSPNLSQHPSRLIHNSINNHSHTIKTCQSSMGKSESMIIDELQQYIRKMEREREILLRSYTILLQLLKHNDLDEKINFNEHEDSTQIFPCD